MPSDKLLSVAKPPVWILYPIYLPARTRRPVQSS